MRRLYRNASLGLISLLIFSCSSDKKNNKQSYQLEPFAENPRIFYGETGNATENESFSGTCESLSLDEINIIQKLVSEKTQKPIWFVRIPLSSSKDHRNQFWVYLAPDFMNTRYRSGQAYTLEIYKYQEKEVRTISDSSWQYIQVSLPHKEFGSVLKTPDVFDLPFRYPPQKIKGDENKQEILSQKEIINLLDYVRDPNSYSNFENPKVISEEDLSNDETILLLIPPSNRILKDVVSKPLVSIVKNSDEYRVTFGYNHGPLYARYIIVKMIKTKDSYEIIDWNIVIS